MKQPSPRPTVDDHPALIDWFIEHDPPFEAFTIGEEDMDRVRQDLHTLLRSAAENPELLRRSIQELIGYFGRAVENANSGEMAGFRAICRILIYVLREKHDVRFEEIIETPGANFLEQHGFSPAP